MDTKPELFVRRALHGQGYRFRLHGRGLPGKPDIVFKKRKRAVFVHGCFWHRHGCKRTTHPKSRRDYWQDKFAKNVARDRRNTALLADDGWDVFVAWECEIDSDEDAAAEADGVPRTAARLTDAGREVVSQARYSSLKLSSRSFASISSLWARAQSVWRMPSLTRRSLMTRARLAIVRARLAKRMSG